MLSDDNFTLQSLILNTRYSNRLFYMLCILFRQQH